MDEKSKKQFSEEINKIIQSRYEFIDKHYLIIRDSYQNHYEWTEPDPLRHEVCICIMFGLCQAAITLTNHLLESLLKYALIIKHSENKKVSKKKVKGKIITSMIEMFKEGQELYENANLNTTINCACTIGLITKKQKMQLHEMRERFRNAYSHSDKVKTFGESSMPVTGVRLENDELKIDESIEPKVADLIVGQGLVQAMIAQKEAPQYFLYIDSLVREIREKIFGPIDNLI